MASKSRELSARELEAFAAELDALRQRHLTRQEVIL